MSLLAAYHFHWQYDSAISRIPIFLLGIFFFMKKDMIDKRKALLFGMLTIFVGLGGVIICKSYFFLASMCSPMLMLCCIQFEEWLKRYGMKKVINTFNYLGSKSLEIFVGHSIGRHIISSYLSDSGSKLFYYILFTIVFTLIVDSLNMIVNKLIFKKCLINN